VAQSLQLRAAWQTPCVQFAAGGWPVYLKIGAGEPHGEHFYYGQPYALVWTGGATSESWSRDFSHEILETLVDPTTNRDVWRDSVDQAVEVADPVEWNGYQLDGVFVSDFVFPSWFAGATTGDPKCQGAVCVFPGPVIAPADASGPYDELQLLSAPWRVSTIGRQGPMARLGATATVRAPRSVPVGSLRASLGYGPAGPV